MKNLAMKKSHAAADLARALKAKSNDIDRIIDLLSAVRDDLKNASKDVSHASDWLDDKDNDPDAPAQAAAFLKAAKDCHSLDDLDKLSYYADDLMKIRDGVIYAKFDLDALAK